MRTHHTQDESYIYRHPRITPRRIGNDFPCRISPQDLTSRFPPDGESYNSTDVPLFRRIMIVLAATSAVCSFLFGWSIGWPLALVITIGLIYAFTSLGDSPVLSAALTEAVASSYLGAALGLRSLLGFGAAAAAPLVFGAILGWTNPSGEGQKLYGTWGWAFGVLGIGGLGPHGRPAVSEGSRNHPHGPDLTPPFLFSRPTFAGRATAFQLPASTLA